MAFFAQLRQVWRRLSRSPLFTGISLLTLAIGIGANTAIFSVIEGILLKPLPYAEADRLVGVWEAAPAVNIKEVNASPATYFTFRDENRTFEDTGIWGWDSVTITGIGQPEQTPAISMTDGVLSVLRARPALGRLFTRSDDLPGRPKTMILTWGYWQRKFGGDRAVIGRRVIANGEAREIIGVLPRDFRFMNVKTSLFLPMQLDRGKAFIGNFSYRGVARLKPGVTMAQANADEGRMLQLMLHKFPPAPGIPLAMFEKARFAPNLRPLRQDVVGDIGKVLWVLMGTVGIVLFIAIANVANLMLVRAESRQQEFAIRSALGAGRGQIAREMLLESVTLGLIGGVLGVGLAYAALQLLVAIGPSSLPRMDEIAIDTPVLLFALAISIGAGLVFGLVPSIKYAGARVAMALREGGRSLSESRDRRRARSALVVVQVALALVLLISSGLMIRTLQAMKRVQPGFTAPDQILTLRISIPDTQAPKDEQALRMENNIADKIAAIPGVSSVGLTSSVTMDGYDSNDPIFAQDHVYAESEIPPMRRYKSITPGYFKTMGNPLLTGRDLTWTDIYDGRPVVMVSDNLARELWGSPAAAIGKRVRENPSGVWREVIGVVGNERDNGVDKKAPAIAYWPILIHKFWQFDTIVRRDPAFVIRSPRTGSAAFLEQVKQAVWSVNPEIPVAGVQTVREIYDHSMARTSFTLVMLAIAAGMALLLGIVGIYGVISYSVSRRTREIGIRIALGAQQQTVTGMFVRDGLILTGIGLGCGLAVATALTRLMSALLYDVSPVDPVTYIAVALALAAAAFCATYIPARRATAIDPADALRAE